MNIQPQNSRKTEFIPWASLKKPSCKSENVSVSQTQLPLSEKTLKCHLLGSFYNRCTNLWGQSDLWTLDRTQSSTRGAPNINCVPKYLKLEGRAHHTAKRSSWTMLSHSSKAVKGSWTSWSHWNTIVELSVGAHILSLQLLCNGERHGVLQEEFQRKPASHAGSYLQCQNSGGRGRVLPWFQS